MKNKFFRILSTITVISVLFFLVSCAPQPVSGSLPSEGTDEYPHVTTSVIRTDLVYTTLQSAAPVPRVVQNLTFGISGDITEVYVGVDGFVKAGAILAELDPADHLARIERSEIDLQILEVRKQQRDNDLINANNSLIDARAALNIARARGIRANIDRAQVTLRRVELNIELLELQNETFKLDYENSHEAHNQLVSDLEKTVMKAPSDGYILFYTDLNIGERAERDTVIFDFACNADFLLQITSREAIHLQGQENIKATINDVSYNVFSYIPVRGDNVWSARVPPTTQVFLAFRYFPYNLQLDQMISVGIMIEKKNVLAIPRRSIRYINGETSVDVLDGDTIINIPIELGIVSGDLVEVTSGLSDGDIVIIT